MTINDVIDYSKLTKYNTVKKCSDIQKAYIATHQVKKEILKELLKSFIDWFNNDKIKIDNKITIADMLIYW